MKKIFYIISAASMVFAASCAKEQMPVVENTDNVVLKTFTADLADADTKTSLVDGRKVHWTEGDKISVFDNVTAVPNNATNDQIKYANREFTSANIDGVMADFTGYVTENATEYIAVYPYLAGTQCNGELRVHLDETQKFVAGGFDTNTNVMIAKTTGDHFSFKNLFGLVKVTIPEGVKSVTLMSNNYISGKFRVSFNEDGSFKDIKGINNDNSYRDITMQIDGASGTCYFVVAPGTHSFTICFTATDGKRYSYTASGSQQLKSNQVVNIGGPASLSGSEVEVVPYYKASILDKVQINAPEGATFKSDYSRVIASVSESGEVTLGKWPGTAVVRVTTSDNKVYPVMIEAAPLYRDDERMLEMWGATSGDRKGENFSYEVVTSNNETYLKVTSDEAKYSCLRRSQKAWFAPAYAPLVAFRVSQPAAVEEGKTVKSYSFKVDVATYGFAGTNYYGEMGGGNKTWQNVYTCSDGSKIYVYNIAEQKFSCGYCYPMDFMGDPNNLTIKYCDFKDADGAETRVTFNFYWFRTYGSWAEFDAHLAEWKSKTGLDAQWGNEYKTE